MEKCHDMFIANLMLILGTLQETNKNASKLIDAFNNDQIDVQKEGTIIKKIHTVLDNHSTLLENKDPQLFNLVETTDKKVIKLTIIPAIDIALSWEKINEVQKENIWKYLTNIKELTHNMIYEEFDKNSNQLVKVDTPQTIFTEFKFMFPDSKLLLPDDFNPYIGVGSNDLSFGVTELLSGPEHLPENAQSASGFGKLFGIDKLLNTEELMKQLKNLTKEDIDAATQNIKKLLEGTDENTSDVLGLVLNGISEELKKDDITAGNPTNNILKIAEGVATKVMPKINKKKIDVDKMLNSAKNLATKYKDKDGKPLFDEKNNPLNIVTQLMEGQLKNSRQAGNKKNKNNTTESNSEEECIKQCQNIIRQMGLPNMDGQQIKDLNLDELDNMINKKKDKTKLKNNS